MACDWFTGNVSGTPDLFNACSPDQVSSIYHSVGVPCNFATICTAAGQLTPGQPALTGRGYAGLIGFVPQTSATPTDAGDYREYLAHQITPALTLNQAYYVGFRANIAPASGLAIPSLGMAFTTLPALAPPSRVAYPGSGRIPLAAVASGPVASAPVSGWNQIQGIYTATGTETQVLVGNFGPGYGPAPSYTAPAYSPGPGASIANPRFPELATAAYYFIEDVVIQAMPTAGPDQSDVCGTKLKLGAGCELPASAGATYAWSPIAGLSNPNSLFTRLVIGASSVSQYTLTITIPNGALPPIVHTSTTNVYSLPTAGNSVSANCGSRVILGTNCLLPPVPGTQYVWSPTTDLVGDPLLGLNIPHPTLLVGPNTAPVYTLTVSTPYLLANGSTAYTISTSTVGIMVLGNPAPLSISTAQNVPLCAGSAFVLTASGGNGTNYSWSSPQLPGFSATGRSVTVTLVAGTMTFVLTSTTCGATAINLNVQAQCCLLDEYRERGVRITDINGRYDASTGSPFNQGPGAIYHVKTYLDFYDLLFTLEPGVKVLMDGGAEILLNQQAGLRMNGATLTAACDEMWTGVGIWGKTRGIITEDLVNPAATLYSTIEHSKYGLSYRDYDGLAPFRISHVNFRQNRYSIEIGRWTVQTPPANGMVTYCTFDSDSSAMKFPYQYRDASHYYYSQHHITLEGDARAIVWDHNKFDHAMVGVFVPAMSGWVNLEDNVFRNCYWAGVALGDIPYVADSAPLGESEIKLTSNHFYLPVYQPQTGQRWYNGYNVGYAQHFVDQCYGAFLPFVKVEAYANTFEQAGLYDPRSVAYDFDAARPLPDIGLRANLLYQAKNNTFERLGHGMQLSLAANAPVSVLGNTFSDCQVGVSVKTRTGNQPSNMPPSPTGDPTLFTSCNTFDPDRDRPGTSTGLLIEPSAAGAPALTFDDVVNPGYPLKDLFVPKGRAVGDFININNQSGSPINYNTFTDQVRDYRPFAIAVTFSGNTIINGTPGDRNQSCALEGFPGTGLQLRPGQQASPPAGNSLARLDQNVPNPCSGSTTFSYRLPAGTRQAGITIRRGLDGVEVGQVAVKVAASEYVLDLRPYAPGLYFYTLTADGAPLQTKRMLVE